MLAWKIAPALAAGCTVVLKPAEFTPLTALCFAEIARDAGLPAGVLNIVTGDGDTGKALVAHKGIDKLAFTGSTEVGKIIRRATAGRGIKLSLELGGKSPFIVFDDADLDSVVEGVVDAIWFNQGQVCCAGSRLLVHEGIATQLEEKLRARMETLRVGSPLDKSVDMGAIVDPVQLERIRTLVDAGVRDGAQMWQPSWAVPSTGCFYPPTLFTGVSPAARIVQEEIFGPVLVSMTFRTPAEAIELANNTPYGLASSVWTENINLALDIAPRIKSGIVWVNSTNLFDAAAGFGGYKESGFGREGGREGMYEYLVPSWKKGAEPVVDTVAAAPAQASSNDFGMPEIDRTPKFFIGGKQVRPDGGYSITVRGPDGATAHNRAQVLYYIAENLSARASEFARRIDAMDGGRTGKHEVEQSVARLFTYAAWADKYDGAVHSVPMRGVTLAMNEPIGVMALVCPSEHPLLGVVSLVAPAIAMGNTTVVIPSERYPLAATDFYQVLETSDVPAGVVNIITGQRDALAKTLAEHDEVDGLWYFGPQSGATAVERAAADNMKRTWTEWTRRDWTSQAQGEGRDFLRHATQVKNIWIPYGE
jgi:aldehyde dehydrogenase (NAD+)